MTQLLAGRRIQPAAFVLMCAALLEAVTLMPLLGWHEEYHASAGTLSTVIVHGAGVFGAVVAVAFGVAWWRGSRRLLDRAYAGSSVLWLWAAAVGVLQGAALGRVVFALLWAVLSIGSAWLEEGADD